MLILVEVTALSSVVHLPHLVSFFLFFFFADLSDHGVQHSLQVVKETELAKHKQVFETPE